MTFLRLRLILSKFSILYTHSLTQLFRYIYVYMYMCVYICVYIYIYNFIYYLPDTFLIDQMVIPFLLSFIADALNIHSMCCVFTCFYVLLFFCVVLYIAIAIFVVVFVYVCVVLYMLFLCCLKFHHFFPLNSRYFIILP